MGFYFDFHALPAERHVPQVFTFTHKQQLQWLWRDFF